MKLEIEITEEEIKSALERKVRVAIADQNNSWQTDQLIKDTVRKQWGPTVESKVAEMLGDSARINDMVQRAIDAKIKSHVAKAFKEAKTK